MRAESGPRLVALRCYREIRSALFPGGLPDRTDATVIEAFTGAWLLLEHSSAGCRMVGVADDYEAARDWLVEQPVAEGAHRSEGARRPEGSDRPEDAGQS